jgi:predicted metal-binding protein
MIDIELDEEMEEPCPCQVCGVWFDLQDGSRSPKKPGIVICESCADEEQEEVDREEEIQELRDSIEDAAIAIRDAKERLIELGVQGIDHIAVIL